jgi:hypothetical protein
MARNDIRTSNIALYCAIVGYAHPAMINLLSPKNLGNVQDTPCAQNIVLHHAYSPDRERTCCAVAPAEALMAQRQLPFNAGSCPAQKGLARRAGVL